MKVARDYVKGLGKRYLLLRDGGPDITSSRLQPGPSRRLSSGLQPLLSRCTTLYQDLAAPGPRRKIGDICLLLHRQQLRHRGGRRAQNYAWGAKEYSSSPDTESVKFAAVKQVVATLQGDIELGEADRPPGAGASQRRSRRNRAPSSPKWWARGRWRILDSRRCRSLEQEVCQRKTCTASEP